jgi:transposase
MKRLTKTGSGRLKLRISGKHLLQLQRAARTHNKPAIRERAAAILKVVNGQSVDEVAQHGLLVRRHRSTVYNWIETYFSHGLNLWQQPRKRRRKVSESQQKQLLKILISQSPQDFGAEQTRWTLALLHQKVDFLSVYKSLSSIFNLISSLRLAWIRCKDFTESIDPSIPYKIRRNRRILGYVRTNPHKAVMLFLDEFSVYRQPLRGKAWAMKGTQPKNQRSRNANTRFKLWGPSML